MFPRFVLLSQTADRITISRNTFLAPERQGIKAHPLCHEPWSFVLVCLWWPHVGSVELLGASNILDLKNWRVLFCGVAEKNVSPRVLWRLCTGWNQDMVRIVILITVSFMKLDFSLTSQAKQLWMEAPKKLPTTKVSLSSTAVFSPKRTKTRI